MNQPNTNTKYYTVLGFGAEAQATIDLLQRDYALEVYAEMYDNARDWRPTDDTALVILLGCGQTDVLERTAALCASTDKEGPLVLAIGADGMQLPSDKLPHCCSVPTGQLTDAVRGILDVIVAEGYINLDFNDIITVFEREGAFEIAIAGGKGEGRMDQAAHGIFEGLNDIEHDAVLLVLYYNPDDMAHPLLSNEKADLIAVLNELDTICGAELNSMWGVQYDKTLTDGEIRLVAIAN